jgi:hypothetical protein
MIQFSDLDNLVLNVVVIEFVIFFPDALGQNVLAKDLPIPVINPKFQTAAMTVEGKRCFLHPSLTPSYTPTISESTRDKSNKKHHRSNV